MIKRMYWIFFALLVAPGVQAANNDLDLGAPSSGPLAAVAGFLQEIVNFAGGPGALFIVFIASCLGVGLWVIAPKSGSDAVAWLVRIFVGGIFIFNIALLLAWLQSF